MSLAGGVPGVGLQPYIPAPKANHILYLLFTDDCLLLGHATVRCAQGFMRIMEDYYLTFGQRVNFIKFDIHFSSKTPILVRRSIQEILGIVEHEGTLHYLGVPITGGRLLKANCYHLVKVVHDRVEGWKDRTLSLLWGGSL